MFLASRTLYRRPAGEPRNALGHRRMRGEEAAEARPAQEKRNDKKVRGRWRGLHVELLGVGVELLQRAGQSVWVSGHMSSRGVRLVFPGAGNGKLDEHSRKGSENEHENSTATQAAAAAVS